MLRQALCTCIKTHNVSLSACILFSQCRWSSGGVGGHAKSEAAQSSSQEPHDEKHPHKQDKPHDSLGDDKHLADRDYLICEILSRDKEIFELKRQHELSMLRVEQSQRRVLKDQEDRGMYYEQNCNVHTFDTVSVGLYTQRNTLYHTLGVERLRNVKIFVIALVTLATCLYLYYRYMINPDWVYVEKPLKVLGSRVGQLREIRAQREQKEEERRFLQEQK